MCLCGCDRIVVEELILIDIIALWTPQIGRTVRKIKKL